MAFDSMPLELPSLEPETEADGEPPRQVRPRTVVAALVLAALLVSGFVATGAGAEVEHALAHAFPSVMGDGCGGG
jgi:hypothetical protein